MNFEKIIWKLFKLDRRDFNKADKQIEKILRELYEKGKQQGIKEERRRIKEFLK